MTSVEGEPQRVVLVHGLARSARMFIPMERALRREGYETIAYDYRSTQAGAAKLIEDFCAYLDSLPDPGRKTHLVGFSLGAILIRGAMLAGKPASVGRVVMIGPPNRGADILNQREATLTRQLFGPAVEDLKEGSAFLKTFGEPEGEIGVIAGTRRFFLFNPSSWLHWFSGEKASHDGTIKVRNTQLSTMTDFVTVSANHTYMAMYEETIRQTVEFLGTGRFLGGYGPRSGTKR